MPYNETMADRIREALADEPVVEEKAMFGSLCFMVNDKMFACVTDTFTMWRIGEASVDALVEETGVDYMIHGKRRMKDFVHVDNDVVRGAKELMRLMGLARAHNAVVKPAKRKKT